MQSDKLLEAREQSHVREAKGIQDWASHRCEPRGKDMWRTFDYSKGRAIQSPKAVTLTFKSNWADSVPALIRELVVQMQKKKNQEIQFAVIQLAVDRIEKRMQRLESLQTKIIPIDSFAPEPYIVLKPILISVQAIEEEFEASWFDANIHFSGGNEDEAVRNLKGLILDRFDSCSNKSPDRLGPEPIRQLAVMREYIQKMA